MCLLLTIPGRLCCCITVSLLFPVTDQQNVIKNPCFGAQKPCRTCCFMCEINVFTQCLTERCIPHRTCSLMRLLCGKRQKKKEKKIQRLVLMSVPTHHHQYSSMPLEVWCTHQRSQKNQKKKQPRMINNLISPLIMLVHSGKVSHIKEMPRYSACA